jgi:hypothetical protein
MQQVLHCETGIVDICAISLATTITVNITKMESMKPHPYVMYYTSPGLIFHVDSEYEVRNQILDWYHVLWADLYQTAACTVDSHIKNFPTVSITNSTFMGLSCDHGGEDFSLLLYILPELQEQ